MDTFEAMLDAPSARMEEKRRTIQSIHKQARALQPHEKAMLAHDGYLANDPRKLVNLEAELAAIVATVKPLDLEQALEMVKAAGYAVSKPKAKAVKKPLGLNAVGKPYGAQYNPNYKMKYHPRRYAYP